MYDRSLLSEKQRLMVEALVEGAPIKEIAQRLNVTPRTIWTWRQIPIVKHFIYTDLAERNDVTGGQGAAVLPEVIAMLKNIATAPLDDPLVSNTDRISAARVLMSGAADFHNRKALEQELAKLENRLVRLHSAIKMEVDESMGQGLASADPAAQEEEDLSGLTREELEEQRELLLLAQGDEEEEVE